MCNEDRKAYMQSVDELVAIYKPLNQAAYACVGDMAAARWQIRRLSQCITIHWNLALIAAGNKPAGGNLAPELLKSRPSPTPPPNSCPATAF